MGLQQLLCYHGPFLALKKLFTSCGSSVIKEWSMLCAAPFFDLLLPGVDGETAMVCKPLFSSVQNSRTELAAEGTPGINCPNYLLSTVEPGEALRVVYEFGKP